MKPQVQNRDWDTFDAYLFDVDGTLLHCTDAVHYFAFCEALTSIAGRPMNLDGVVAHGNVDNGILRDAFAHASIREAVWRPRLPELHEQMCRYVAAHHLEFSAGPLPGVRAVLEHLQARSAVLGIASGNLAAIGRAKLRHVGLADFFTVGGWSDSHETRTEVFAAAVQKMKAAAGPQATICVLGDTPADIAAARANHLPVIAIATGIYTAAQLASNPPDLLLPTLEALL